MDLTLFLAQLWGPVMLALGIGFFTSRSYYTKIYSGIEKNALALTVFGMAAMAVGIAQLLVHNTWDTPLQIMVSLLGWGLLLKGVMYIVAPNFVDRIGDRYVELKALSYAGALLIVCGVYLTYTAYIA